MTFVNIQSELVRMDSDINLPTLNENTHSVITTSNVVFDHFYDHTLQSYTGPQN